MKPIRTRNYVQTTPIGSKPKAEKPKPASDDVLREVLEQLVAFSATNDVGPSQQLRNIVENARKALISYGQEAAPAPVYRPSPPKRRPQPTPPRKR